MKFTVTDESRFDAVKAAFQDRKTFTLTGAGLTTEYLATEFSYSTSHPGIGAPCVELELVQVSKASGTTQWSGEGLPPVGLEFEWRYGDHAWKKGEALYIGSIYAVLKSTEGGEQHYYLRDMQFRPIRTAEQIAAEERERVANEMVRRFAFPASQQDIPWKGLFLQMYDCGVLKP